MKDTKSIIETIRQRAGLKSDAAIGLVGSFGSESIVDMKSREITWIANTSDIDLEDEVVVPEGLDGTRYFFKNRKIFVDHDYRLQMAVGNMRSAKLTQTVTGQSAWRVHAYIVPTQLGNDLLTFASEAGGIGSSIGFASIDAGKPTKEEAKRYGQGDREPKSVVRKADWLELSATAIPMNVSCQGQVIRQDTRALDTLDNLVCKSKIKRASAIALGLPAKKKFQVSFIGTKRIAVVDFRL